MIRFKCDLEEEDVKLLSSKLGILLGKKFLINNIVDTLNSIPLEQGVLGAEF